MPACMLLAPGLHVMQPAVRASPSGSCDQAPHTTAKLHRMEAEHSGQSRCSAICANQCWAANLGPWATHTRAGPCTPAHRALLCLPFSFHSTPPHSTTCRVSGSCRTIYFHGQVGVGVGGPVPQLQHIMALRVGGRVLPLYKVLRVWYMSICGYGREGEASAGIRQACRGNKAHGWQGVTQGVAQAQNSRGLQRQQLCRPTPNTP